MCPSVSGRTRAQQSDSMLTRAWMGPVSPDWTIRVGGGDPAVGVRSRRGPRPTTGRSSSSASRPPRGVRRHRRAPPPPGVSAVLPLRRQPRGRGRPGAGRVHPRVQGPARDSRGSRASRPGSIGSPSTSASIGWRSRRRGASRLPGRPSASTSAPSGPMPRSCATSARPKCAPRSRSCRRSSARR